MTKRILDSRLPAMVYQPAGVFDVGYFEACHKAGTLPVFDAEFLTDEDATAHIRELSTKDFIFGVRLNGARSNVVSYLREHTIANLDAVIVYFEGEIPQQFEGPGREVKLFVEVVDFEAESKLSVLSPFAVIVRGFEAGGRNSRFTSFILMQWYLENTALPVVVHGGVGFNNAAGLFAAGCAAVVLDSQLYLMDESPLSDNFRRLMNTVEEGDSTVVGDTMQTSFRFFSKLGTRVTKELKDEEAQLEIKADGSKLLYERIAKSYVRINENTVNAMQSLFFLGQDGIYAKAFAARSKNLSEVIRLFFVHIGECLSLVDQFDPMNKGTKLAAEHGTEYPIIQGPMANISDNADFAAKVLEGGCLPFFAMGNLPANLFEKIVVGGNEKVKNFGCGLIGLPALNKSYPVHIELLKKYKVPYALIAAGYPAQANELEAGGVKCYLHCPSSSMLENAIAAGVKRYIFEGMEAGGHIGTLTSLVLWEVAMEKFLAQKDGALAGQRIIFAGGIGTKSSTAFVSGMASILASKGAAVGVSVGTAYLFTKEIVETGALKPLYQKLLLERNETTVIGATLGLSTRTIYTPYSKRMHSKEREMIREKVPLTDRKHYFEGQNVGSLLIAAKAFTPNFAKLKAEGVLEYINYSDDEALDKGNYHTGESLAFFGNELTVGDVHKIFFGWKKSLRDALNRLEYLYGGENSINDEIAIIGMGCLYPDAPDTKTYWENIIGKKYSIRDISPERCNPEYYYSDDKKADDKTYTKKAGAIDYYSFDANKYGYSDKETAHMSLSQKLILDAAMQAVADAGYPEGKGLPKEKTSVIVGTCLTNELNSDLQLRQLYPEFVYHLDQIDEFKNLSDEEKESFLNYFKEGISKGRKPKLPDGVALNVESARIAKHLGVEGQNFTIDAACATSFAAIDTAIKDLLSGDNDVAIVGGVNTNHTPEAFVGFSKLGALSADGSYPFDERAGGFVLGEGAGVVVLKRMKDAVADGDRIYCVVKGIGTSSDGKGRFIAAPSAEGQGYAIARAFENMRAPITPDDVDYIEAHGTSTLAGDSTEMETIKKMYTGSRPKGVSSVKSQIGHLLGGAGNAGLIKVILSMQHKTLPPNGLFEKLSPKLHLDGTPLYVIKDVAEWKIEQGRKRRAAVSSYGFGGINYHMVVEEFDGAYKALARKIFANTAYDFNDDRIVITAIGTVLPGAQSADAFWSNMQSGKVTIGEKGIARFHNEYFAKEKDPAFNIPMVKMSIATEYTPNGLKYKIPPSAMKVIDRGQFFALDAAGQVIDEAKLSGDLVKGNKIALMFGTTSSEKNVEQIVRTRIPFMLDVMAKSPLADDKKNAIAAKFAERIRATYFKNTEDTIPGMLANITSGRVANFYNMNGANFIIDAECASSAVAMSVAVKDLRAGTSDFVITGGVDTNLLPATIHAFNLLKVISHDDAKIFDKTSSGLIMGEGAALLCLTTLRRAKARGMKIYGELTGFSFRSFPCENMIAPTEPGFLRTFNDMYSSAPVAPSQIRYVDGFASSNKIVDKWELTALNSEFGKNTVLGNAKPELGYYRAANPAVVIARLALMAHNRVIPKLHSYSKENSMMDGSAHIVAAIDQISVANHGQMFLAANFSGLGGIHGHAVVRTLPGWLEKSASGTATSSVYSAAPAAKTVERISAASGRVKICALLSGQGAQSPGMMKTLYASNACVKNIFDKGEAIFKSVRGYSLLDMMFGNDPALNSTENTQPAIFLSSAAVYAALAEKGFVPDSMIGHSIGEYTALYCAGIISFEEAMKLVLVRSTVMKEAANEKKGAIMVVFADAKTTEALISESTLKDVWVANKNSDKQTAVSGVSEGIDAFVAFLGTKKITCKKLNLSGAFHSPLFTGASVKMEEYLANLAFNGENFTRIISNVTAHRYPSDAAEVKKLLIRQISSPVEFVESVKRAASDGATIFVEAGPNKLLSNLLRDIPAGSVTVIPMVDPKAGEAESFAKAIDQLERAGAFGVQSAVSFQAPHQTAAPSSVSAETDRGYTDAADFNEFLEKNRDAVTKLLHAEFEKHKRARENEFFKRAGFYGGSIVISGVSIGLPGRMNKVFEEANFDRILSGMNLIEPIDQAVRQKMVDRNIVRVSKDPQGNAKFVEIHSVDEVLQLAGQLGYFDGKKDYGIDLAPEEGYQLAMAAGIEALKDAKIPMVQQFETTSVGSSLAKGYALPAELQERTGVIFTTVFSAVDSIVTECERFAGDQFYRAAYQEFEKIFQYLMANVKEDETRRAVTDWFGKVRDITGVRETYKFDKNFMFKILQMGNAYLAQMIRAKGPNMQSNAACASVTQAVGIANDWIRTGRCDRVIVIASEIATRNSVLPFLGSAFVALGAATIKKVVSEAAKPFDADRNGLIMGSGAVGIIVERADSVKERGFNGQAEILGVQIKNSAFHGSRLDVKHISAEMKTFIEHTEQLHDLSKDEYASKLLFMSHETYTPARGGSADAEVFALRNAFPNHYKQITITNTKGYTGHTLGAGIEDCVLVAALQRGKAAPIANLVKIPENFADLNFSKGERKDYRYGIHFAAGFGSQFAILFIRKIDENSVDGNDTWKKWLVKISGTSDPHVSIVNGALSVTNAVASAHAHAAPQAAVAKVAPVRAAAAASGAVTGEIKKLIAEMTGYGIEMLDEKLDLEGDLGIDTVKQVEIFGKICERFGIAIPEDLKLSELNTIEKLSGFISGKTGAPASAPAAVSSAAPAVVSSSPVAASAGVIGDVKKIIAEMTGYGEEMLDPKLDLEGDLGIDTVKQVEIFGKICERFGIAIPEDLKLSELNTIEKLSGFISGKTGAPASAPAAVSSAAPAAASSAPVAASAGVIGDVKKIIAEMTGYGEEMLDPKLDLEGDLGIDTVKQVEIFGKICERFGIAIPEDLKLSELSTIEKLSGFIAEKTGQTSSPAQTAAPAVASSTVSSADGSAFLKDITRIIAEMTGYGEEMLDPKLDLEGDLGIDTVKQVEIFGKVCENFGLTVPEDLRLSELNTIEKLSGFVAAVKSGNAPATVTQPASVQPEHASSAVSSIARFVVRAETAPLKETKTDIFSGKKVLITADAKGIAKKIGDSISSQGASVTYIGSDALDFADAAAVEAKMKELETQGVDGLIHCLPLDGYSGKKTDDKSVSAYVKSLFVMIKALHQSLNRKGAFIATLGYDSIVFPYNEPKAAIYPVFGSLAGMLKSVNKEFNDTLVKAVDFSSDYAKKDKADDLVALFVKELASGDARVESGYKKGERFVVSLLDEKVTGTESFVKEGDRVLLSGGARGITFEILRELVKTYKVRPVILARSSIDSIDPEFLKDGVNEKTIFAAVAGKMVGSKPVEIKKAAARIANQLATIHNIKTLEAMGVEVKYHAVDITDAAAVAKIVGTYDSIDGVIHAAGLEESQLIAKKDLATFNAVFDTKTLGAKSLVAAFEGKSYRYFIGFSSVAARFGNEGQCDYSAANDMLARTLQSEKRHHPDRVYKVYDWTAWGETGMATKESVMKFLTSQGIELMPVKVGVKFFMADLFAPDEDEVVITNVIPSFDRDRIFSVKNSGDGSPQTPFLGSVIESRGGYEKRQRVLDLSHDIFLFDHARDGVPLFLGSTGVETLAEAGASVAGKGKKLVEMRDFTIPYGIKILQGKPKELLIDAKDAGNGEFDCSIISQFVKDGKAMGSPTLHYKGICRYADTVPAQPKRDFPALRKVTWEGNLKELLYHPQRLFMTRLFDSIDDILGRDDTTLMTRIHNVWEGPFFTNISEPQFITNPVVIDGIFQTCGLVEFMTGNESILPYKIGRMEFFKPIETHGDYVCIAQIVGRNDAEKTRTFNADLCDREGNIILRAEGFQMIAVAKVSPELSVAHKFKLV